MVHDRPWTYASYDQGQSEFSLTGASDLVTFGV